MGTVDLTNQVAVCLHVLPTWVHCDLHLTVCVRSLSKNVMILSVTCKPMYVGEGDTPINLNSPEQLSWVVYSRKVIDKLIGVALIRTWGNTSAA